MPTEVQTIIFKKRYWTPERAVKWLHKHGYTTKKIDIEEKSYRFRQKSPQKYKRFTSKKIKPSVTLVFGFV